MVLWTDSAACGGVLRGTAGPPARWRQAAAAPGALPSPSGLSFSAPPSRVNMSVDLGPQCSQAFAVCPFPQHQDRSFPGSVQTAWARAPEAHPRGCSSPLQLRPGSSSRVEGPLSCRPPLGIAACLGSGAAFVACPDTCVRWGGGWSKVGCSPSSCKLPRPLASPLSPLGQSELTGEVGLFRRTGPP